MSKLIEKIKRQQERPATPIGFGRTVAAGAKPSILLIAKVKPENSGNPVKSIEGADAIILDAGDSGLTADKLPKITKPLGETPWGVTLDESEETVKSLEEKGSDFIVLSPTSPVTILSKNDKTGLILQVDPSMDDGLLRAVSDLPVDAVLATDSLEDNGKLQYHHLMILRHLAVMVGKPLLVPTPAGISKDELQALWDAGIEAVVVTVDIAKDENLKGLHEMAVSLPPRAEHHKNRMGVLLPRTAEKQPEPQREEEEEDEPE